MTTGSKIKGLFTNFLYNFGGILIMNAVLQLFIYPSMNRRLGPEQLGIALFLLAFVNILSPSFGLAVNNNRLVSRRLPNLVNGDFNAVLLLFNAAAILLTLLAARNSLDNALSFVLLALLLFLTTWRYYAEVEFRLNLTFRNYFIFYIALTIGYLVGYAGFVVLHDWYIIFLLGELAALTYVWVKGSIFHPIWQRGEHFPRVLKASSTLAVSYLIANSSLQLDRILLKFFVSNIAVTEYYVVSLIGKALVMVVAPLNSIILSYLTRRESGITRKSFLSYLALILLGCAVFFALCQLVVPIFIKLLYPDMYTSVKGLILIANLAQIIAVGSSAIFAVVLTFAHEKWQLILQAAHIVLFVAIAIPLTKSQGVYGFALSSVIANTLRMLSIVAVGIINGGKRETIHEN